MIAVVVFIALFSGILGAYWMFVVEPERRATGVVRRRLSPVRKVKTADAGELLTAKKPMSAIGSLDALLERQHTWARRLVKLIREAGVQITVGTLLLGSAVVGLVVFLLAMRASGHVWVAIPAACLACLVPVQLLRMRHQYRVRQFETQFPEALDLIARAMRAGHAFSTGVEMAGTEMPEPTGSEFRLLFDRQNYGMSIPDALYALAERVPILDAKFFVTAVMIQRESGGNLSEILDNLSSVIRDRQRVKRQMRVLSAHGRITGWVLVALAPVLAFALMSANPEHRRGLLEDPLGIRLLIGAVCLQLIGTYVINRIVKVEY